MTLNPNDSIQVPPIISPEPSVLNSYKHGWSALWKNFGMLLANGILGVLIMWTIMGGAIIPYFTLAAILTSGNMSTSLIINILLYLPMFIALVLVIFPLETGLALTFLKAIRIEKLEINHLFSAFRKYKEVMLAGIFYYLITLVASIPYYIFSSLGERGTALNFTDLFITLILYIPVIFINIKLSFVPFLVIDQNIKGIEAISSSWKLTGGHSWQIFGLQLLAIPIVLIGCLCLIIGAVPATMWVYTTLADFYNSIVQKNQPAQASMPAQAEVPPPQPI